MHRQAELQSRPETGRLPRERRAPVDGIERARAISSASTAPLLRKEASIELLRRSRLGDAIAREEVILRFLPLARKLARRYAATSIPNEDLAQVASLALLKAVDRFDPERGGTFEAFAVPTILGELRRHFRDTSWAVHVARGAKERAHDVQEATELLGRRQGRSPSVQEIAQYLELSEEEVLDALRASQAFIAKSLDAPVQVGDDESETTLVSQIGAEDPSYQQLEMTMLAGEGLEMLSEDERCLLRMRFAREMTQSEIGRELGVSQMQVSRLLSSTLGRLRSRLGDISDA